MTTLARLLVAVGVDAEDVDRGVDAVDRKVSSLATRLDDVGARMQSVGTRATLGLTVPLVALGNAAINAASDLQESVNAIRVVFGPAAATIEEFGRTSARTVGLSTRAFNELVTPVGAALLNVGFSQDEAAQSSINLATRAADMASVFNTDVSTALEAIQAGLRGESDPLERFGVGLNEAAVNAKAMELGLADSTSEIDAQDKARARLALIMEQTDRIAGDFANTSGSLANQERIAKAEAENMAAAFGEKLMPIKMRLIEIAGQLLDKFMNLSPGMQDLILKAGMILAAFGPVVFMLGSLARGISSIITLGTQVGPPLISAIGWILRMGVAAVTTAAQVAVAVAQQLAAWALLGIQALLHAAKVALAWLIALGPIGLIVAAVAAAVVLIIMYWDEISSAVMTAVRAVIDFVREHWPLIIAVLTGPIGIAVALIVRYWDEIWSVTTRIFGAIADFLGWIVDRIWGSIQAVVGAIIHGFSSVVGFITSIPGWIGSALSWVVGGIAGIFSWALQNLINVVVWGVNTVLWWFGNIPSWIWNALIGLGRMLWDIGKYIIDSLVEGIKSGIGWLKDTVSGIASSITSWKGPIEKDKRLLIPEGMAIMEGLIHGIDEALPGLRDQLGGVSDMISGDMQAMVGARLRVAVPPPASARVTFDFSSADSEMGRALKRMVRVDGRGDVDEAFG